jgi:hypothetical protein
MFTSCKDSTNTKDDSDVDLAASEDVNEDVASEDVFEVLADAEYDLGGLEYEGEVLSKKVWKDTNGENVVLFAKNESEINVYHYLVKPEEPKLLRKVYDVVENCEWDTVLEFVEQSITVTDLDKNDIGEITFAYRIACISDVSPKELKLLVLENGDKYIIRGETVINLGSEEMGGDKNIDPSFESAPKEFLLHADEVWSKVVKE